MPNSDISHVSGNAINSPEIRALIDTVLRRLSATSLISNTDVSDIAHSWTNQRNMLAARNELVHGGTASSLVVPPATVSETTVDALVQTQDAYAQRRRTHAEHSDAVGDHQSKYLLEWQQRVKSHSERSHEEMLSSLWNSGLSWRDISRILKVSVAAIQKWRAGEKMSPKNFANLRDFVAAYDTVAAHKPGVDVAAWIDVPIITNAPVTPRDIWISGDRGNFFEYALGDMEPESALDAYDPDWRHRYLEDGFETFVGADGNLSIRAKNRQGIGK